MISHRPFHLRFGIEEVLILLMMAGNTAWIYPWAMAVAPWMDRTSRPAITLPAVAGLLVMGVVATRLMSLAPGLMSAGRFLLPLLGLAAACGTALAGLPAFSSGEPTDELVRQLLSGETGTRAIGSAIFVAAVWGRGVNMGRSRPNLSMVEDQLRTGVVGLCALLAMSALAGRASAVSDASLLLPTLLFLATSLLEMPLASVAEVTESSRHRGSQRLTPGGSWLVMLLGIVAFLLAATLLLAQLLTFQRIEQAWEAISSPVSAFLESAVYILAIPVGLVVSLLIFLLSLLPQHKAAPNPQDDPLKALDQLREQTVTGTIPNDAIMVMKAVIAVALAILFLWFVARALSRLGRGSQDEGVEESRDIVWEWGWLSDLWKWLLARLRPARRLMAAATAAARGNGALPGSVRALYREFLALGARQGMGRRRAETPLEYERRLLADPALPGSEELREITASYLKARYAPSAPNPPDHGAVASALERLRDLWQNRH